MNLKYDTYGITYRELPNEVALTLSITNCPNRCKGCHSPHLRDNIGTDIWEIKELLRKYHKHITAVCFLGHGHISRHKQQFIDVVQWIKEEYPSLKLGLYSGFDYILKDFTPYLDYYKIGRYIPELGGLDKPETTNQILLNLK